jgi:hypothetical protein
MKDRPDDSLDRFEESLRRLDGTFAALNFITAVAIFSTTLSFGLILILFVR